MTELLEKAFNRIRSLPNETQDELARVLMRLAGDEDDVYLLSAEENADLIAAEEEIACGDLATDGEVEMVFGKFRA